MGYSKKILNSMFIFLLLYTIASLIINAITGNEPSTLTTCVFTFCGAEGGFLGAIKIFKLKKGVTKNGEEKDCT